MRIVSLMGLAGLCLFGAGLIATTAMPCNPKPGDSSSRVIAQCGEPNQRQQMLTAGRSLREEWDYVTMLVVLEDHQVLVVFKDEDWQR